MADDMFTVPGSVLRELRELRGIFRRLQARQVISCNHDKSRAAIEYSIILTVAEYEQLEKMRADNYGDL